MLLQSQSGEKCRVYNEPGENVRVRNLETGEIIEVMPDSRGVIEFLTAADYEYAVKSKSAPLESFTLK